MQKLVKLGNGSWVDPCLVVAVIVAPGRTADQFGPATKPKALVQIRIGNVLHGLELYCDTIEDAEELAAATASVINKFWGNAPRYEDEDDEEDDSEIENNSFDEEDDEDE
jgi:hypothetical protein